MDQIEEYGFIPNGGRIYCELVFACAHCLTCPHGVRVITRSQSIAASYVHTRESQLYL